MDRNNGVDPLAPPRPPKLLPRVHKPRAPDPQPPTVAHTAATPSPASGTACGAGTVSASESAAPKSSSSSSHFKSSIMGDNNNTANRSHLHGGDGSPTNSTDMKAPLSPPTMPAPPLPLKLEQIPHPLSDAASFHQVQQLQQLQQQHQFQQLAEQFQQLQQLNSISTVTAPTIVTNLYDNDTNRLNANVSIIATNPELEDYQIYHLTYLPDRPYPTAIAPPPPPPLTSALAAATATAATASLNSPAANTGGTTANGRTAISQTVAAASTNSSGVTAANSFTRRRVIAPIPTVAPASNMPLITIGDPATTPTAGSFLSAGVFLHGDQTAASASVTLAQPRPESERHTNEYVETPLRSPSHQLQLQHASRAQHPAGEHDDGHTTTHHLLLLPQRQHQHQHQQQQRTVAGAAGSAIATTAGDRLFHGLRSASSSIMPANSTAATSTGPNSSSIGMVGAAANAAASNNNNNRCCQRGPARTVITVTTHTEPASKVTQSPTVGATSPSVTTTAAVVPTHDLVFGEFTFETTSTTTMAAHEQQQPITKQPLSRLANGIDQIAAAANNNMATADAKKIMAATTTPLKGAHYNHHHNHHLHHHHHHNGDDDLNSITADVSFVPINGGGACANGGGGNGGTSILIGSDNGSGLGMSGIVCPRCERCRCEMCQGPRPLPQTWVCNKTCLCSADTAIDYASCLCCVKAIFYHCSSSGGGDRDIVDDGSGESCVDNPCTCAPYKRTKRWAWLGALSLVLPCLWCYWPMRACVSSCEYCYNRVAGRGCRCENNGAAATAAATLNINALDNVDMQRLGGGLGSLSGVNAGQLGKGSQVGTGGGGGAAAVGVNGGGAEQHHYLHKPHHHFNHHHHHECAASGNRKGEKRLLDTSLDY